MVWEELGLPIFLSKSLPLQLWLKIKSQMWGVYVSSFDKIYFTGWACKTWVLLRSHFPRPFSDPCPTHLCLEGKTSQARHPRPSRRWRRWWKQASLRIWAGSSPTTGRAIISWMLYTDSKDRTATFHTDRDLLLDQALLSCPSLLGLPGSVSARVLLSQFKGKFPHSPCLHSIPHLLPWPAFSKNPLTLHVSS